MYYKRKAALMLILALIVSLVPINRTNAQSSTIYETITKQTITSGATLENIVRFTDNGWLNINVLRLDLSNQYIKLDTITNPNSIQTPTSTRDLAISKGAVAAINGSFFSTTNQPGLFTNIGPVVESGVLKTASGDFNKNNDSMATFSIDEVNKVLYDYWKTSITLTAPNGNSTPAARYNKPYGGTEDFSIIDRKMRKTSFGATASYPDIVEMVVDNGKVSEIRQGKPAVEIPQNGYIIVTRTAGCKFLTDNFKIGDDVTLDISTNPDWEKIKMSVTGGAILLKDGVMPKPFSHLVNGRHPRTAIGSSKDGKQVIMVTVDGRQQGSIGMTLEELAQLMLDLGAHNALNLDGGGSTTMVARKPGTSSLQVVNNPADGTPRRITTAVGVLSIAPPSTLNGLIIDTSDINIFVNTSRSFTVRGYDRYFNPVEVKPEEIQWSISGISGFFNGNTFYPQSVGEGRIKATIGDVSAELAISSLSSPVELQLSTKSINLAEGETRSFSVTGKNKNGYYAQINPLDVSWSVAGNIGYLAGNTFTATTSGSGYIDAFIGNTHAFCSATVIPTTAALKDDFEQTNGSFLGYPSTVKGSYQLSEEQKRSGKFSGKLTYDFSTGVEETRAAYLLFPDAGIPLESNTLRVGMWVHNSHENSNWLRIEVYDSNNQKYMVDGLKKMDWSGWKYIEIPLGGISSPARLTRVYLVQVNPVAETGTVYIDDLSVVTLDNETAPTNTIAPVADTVTEKFELANAVFTSFPAYVEGTYEVSGEQVFSGKASGKLTYKFTGNQETQAAYVLMPGDGIALPTGSAKIGVWVNNNHTHQNWLRAELVDADGKKQYVTFIKGMDWNRWKYVEVPLDEIKMPAKLTRLYVVKVNPVADAGTVYFDDLTIVSSLPSQPQEVPKDSVQADESNKKVEYVVSDSSFRFSVFGQSREPKNALEKLITIRMADKINKYLEASAIVGNSEHEIVQVLEKPFVSTNTGYKSFDMQNSRFIQLDISKQGMRSSSQLQWHWLLEQLESFNGSNVFLFLADNPKNFTDSLESKLLQDILTKYRQTKFKNIWVFYNGTENTSYMERGIKYLSNQGYEMDGITPDNAAAVEFIVVTVMGDSVTFELKPIV